MSNKQMPTMDDGQNNKNNQHTKQKELENQDNWLHISTLLAQAMAGLTPNQKAGQEQSNLTFIFHVMLQPHRRALKKVILLKLYQQEVLDLEQTIYLFNVFNLRGV
jgi:hypothetical protein